MTEYREDSYATVPLDIARSSGWYARVCEQSEDYAQAEEVIGERFLAFSLVAGLRVVALAVDRDVLQSSIVGFVVGDEKDVYQVPLNEFRRAVVQILSGPEQTLSSLPMGQANRDGIQAYLGIRSILMADVLGIVLRELRYEDEDTPRVVVAVQHEIPSAESTDLLVETIAPEALGPSESSNALESGTELLSLSAEEFRALVRGELAREHAQSLSDLLPQFSEEEARAAARAAEDACWDQVIGAVSSWPRRIASAMRTGALDVLGEEEVARVSDALLALVEAFRKTGRAKEAEDVARMYLQWQPTGAASARVFCQLALIMLDAGRGGQALGLFRRALAMGAPRVEVLPDLARAFNARRRFVAAALCCEEAAELEVGDEVLAATRGEAERELGDAWTKAKELLASRGS